MNAEKLLIICANQLAVTRGITPNERLRYISLFFDVETLIKYMELLSSRKDRRKIANRYFEEHLQENPEDKTHVELLIDVLLEYTCYESCCIPKQIKMIMEKIPDGDIDDIHDLKSRLTPGFLAGIEVNPGKKDAFIKGFIDLYFDDKSTDVDRQVLAELVEGRIKIGNTVNVVGGSYF